MFEAFGGCRAIVIHSSITLRSTDRVKSSRLRTARVVVNNSLGDRVNNVIWPKSYLYPGFIISFVINILKHEMRKFGIWSRIRIWMHLNKINYCDGEARYYNYEKNK